MGQARLDDRCPLCRAYIGGNLSIHIPKCPDRERVLDELEDRARAIRRGEDT